MIQNNYNVYIYIFFHLLFCCKNNSYSEKNNVLEYRSLINYAEENILNGEYSVSLNFYKKAEKNINTMFAIDLNNALISSVKTEDWENAVYWSKKLIGKGITLIFFERDLFDKFKTTPEWSFFLRDYKSIRDRHLKGVDKVMIDSLKILKEIDQNHYCLIPSGKIELKEAFTRTVFIDSLLSKLITRRGFPSEKLVGTSKKSDTFISPLPSFFPLLRHSYQANSSLIEKHLKDAVASGYLKQEVFDRISGIDNMQYAVIDCNIYKPKLSDPESTQENLIVKKIIYNNSNSHEGYIFYAPLSILKGVSKKSFGNHFDMTYSYIANYSGCKE